jgi:hypothetical protein
MQSLEELVHELGEWYEDGPGLITRLEDPAVRTSQPRDLAEHQTGKPGSRPPTSLSPLDWVITIKAEVVQLDMDLRLSRWRQSWDRALAGLPYNAEAAGRWKDVHSAAAIWHSTARTTLGFQAPAMDAPKARCWFCGGNTIRVRVDVDTDVARGWCTADNCIDPETERRPRWSGASLSLLLRSA